MRSRLEDKRRVEWLSTMIPAELVRGVHDLMAAELFVVLPYLGAIAWLVYRGCRRSRIPHPERASRAIAAVDGFVRLLGAAAMAAVVILLALARAAGRSHYRW